MDKELIKKVAGYVIGGAIGAAVGFGVSTFVLDNFVEEEIEEWEDEDQDWINDEQPPVVVRTKKSKEKKAPVDYAGMSKNVNPDLKALADRYRKGPVEVEEETSVPDVVEEVTEETVDRSKPYFITRMEFEEEMMTHQKVFLNIYEDDVLTDAEDNTVIVNPPAKFLGPDGLTSFGKEEMEPDVVHIRNEELGNDYEVNLLHTSYEAAVMGRKKDRKKPADRSRVVRTPIKEEVNEDED